MEPSCFYCVEPRVAQLLTASKTSLCRRHVEGWHRLLDGLAAMSPFDSICTARFGLGTPK